jgi:hypothetical protein
VHIGDHSELERPGLPANHLFEDRVMKIDHVRIGQRVTMVAQRGAVQRGGDNAQLGALTLVMKGEFIPAASSWKAAGAPERLKCRPGGPSLVWLPAAGAGRPARGAGLTVTAHRTDRQPSAGAPGHPPRCSSTGRRVA